jgi:hypothetical protein
MTCEPHAAALPSVAVPTSLQLHRHGMRSWQATRSTASYNDELYAADTRPITNMSLLGEPADWCVVNGYRKARPGSLLSISAVNAGVTSRATPTAAKGAGSYWRGPEQERERLSYELLPLLLQWR